jgi:phenylacetate-coenzyme A ligase PaaK-like adenylate-forming protein
LCLLLGARRLVVPLTLTSSEVLPERSRRLAEDVLGTRVVDLYGQAERVAFASSSGDGYTFLPGYSYLELVPAEGSDGETFEIVGTSLWNLAMPLVRYRTGDLVTLHTPLTEDVLDEVRYGLRPVSRIAGRSDDFLVGPDGARLVGIDHIPRGVGNVVRVQIVQEDRDVVIRVLAKPGFGAGDALQLEANARRKLPPGIRWSIEVVDTLERSSNGKTPFVIRRAGS